MTDPFLAGKQLTTEMPCCSAANPDSYRHSFSDAPETRVCHAGRTGSAPLAATGSSHTTKIKRHQRHLRTRKFAGKRSGSRAPFSKGGAAKRRGFGGVG